MIALFKARKAGVFNRQHFGEDLPAGIVLPPAIAADAVIAAQSEANAKCGIAGRSLAPLMASPTLPRIGTARLGEFGIYRTLTDFAAPLAAPTTTRP